jgi:putative inorganic carbon (HCO3(-)) transporter
LLSLVGLDSAWDRLIAESKIANLIKLVSVQISNNLLHFSATTSIGSWLKSISICLTSILFICLSMPQFANDKQGLAAILLAAFVSWFSGHLLIGGQKQKGNFVDALVLLYFCINIIATCSSHYFAASTHGLLKLVVYIFAYFLFCAQLKERPQHQFTYVFILVFSGVLLSIYGLYQYKIGVAPLATWEDPNIENQATRIYATFNNPNLFAGYLLPIIMLAATQVLANWNLRKWVFSAIAVLVTALLTVAVILTGSRGAYIGAFAGYAALIVVGLTKIWLLKTKRRIIIPTLLLTVPLVIFAVFHYMPGFEHRIVSIFAGREHSSNSFRLNVWLSSLAMLKDNWLIGIGVGNQAFCLAYGLYMRTGFDALGTYCVPLEIAVETGLFGLFVFVLIVMSILYKAHIAFWSPISNNRSDLFQYKRWLTVGAAFGLVALLGHGLVDTVFFRPQIQFIFYLLVSIVIANTTITNPADK